MIREDDMQAIDSLWADWELGEELGEGAFGSVYVIRRRSAYAEDESAVKLIHVPADEFEITLRRHRGETDEQIREHYRKQVDGVVDEIKAMKSLLGAPNVISIQDYGIVELKSEIGWIIGIRMELLEPLDKHFARVGAPDQREVARMGIDLCDALTACHQQGYLHRDVKPENVFYRSSQKHYVLGDFGIARQLDPDEGYTLSMSGTPRYMAPEVLSGRPYDKNADVYSLGVTIRDYLSDGTGLSHKSGSGAPYASDDRMTNDVNKMDRTRKTVDVKEWDITPECVDEGLLTIVDKACEFNPNTRYQTAEEMRCALDRWLHKPDVKPPVRKPSRLPVAIAAAVLVTIIVVLLVPLGNLFGSGSDSENTETEASQSKTETAQPKTETEYEREIQELMSDGDYQRGMDVAEDGLEQYPRSSRLQDLRDRCKEKVNDVDELNRILDDARAYELDDDYKEALRVVENGLKTYPESEDLIDRRSDYQTAADDIEGFIDRAAAMQNNADSRAEIERGLNKYPQSVTLKDEREKYQTCISGSWTGYYTGTFANVNGGESMLQRQMTVYFDEAYPIDEYDDADVPVYGTCYVDDESYRMAGTLNGATRSIHLWWTEWLVRKDTKNTRQFEGTFSTDFNVIDGSTTTMDGDNWSSWHMSK